MAIAQDIHQPSITEFSLKITYVNIHSNISGANGLINTETTQVSIGRVTHATMGTILMKSPDEVPRSGSKSIDTLTTIVVICDYFFLNGAAVGRQSNWCNWLSAAITQG